mgnify:CR=1 FL=1
MLGYVLIDFDGSVLTSEERERLQHPAVAGAVLFSRNYQSTSQLRELTQSIMKIKPNAIVAVDHEGGRVQRFHAGFTKLPAMRKWGSDYTESKQPTLQRLDALITTMVFELQSCGVNVNLSPVLDIDAGLSDIIGSRSLSDNAGDVIRLGERVISQMNQLGMPAVVKHFPGHGRVRADSHLELPVDQRSLSEVMSSDMQPFLKLQSLYSALMPAHIVFPEIDVMPVTFSQFWIRDFLRCQLGYQKLIMTDDLTMQAAGSVGSYADRAQLALSAGCDILLACNCPEGVIEILDQVAVPKDDSRDRRVAEFLSQIKNNSRLML